MTLNVPSEAEAEARAEGCAVAACYLVFLGIFAIGTWWHLREFGHILAQVSFLHIFVAILKLELFLAAVLFGAALLICCFAVGWALLVRGTPQIFLSYHHSNHNQILVCATALRDAKLTTKYVPFSTSHEHDILLDKIYEGIKLAD